MDSHYKSLLIVMLLTVVTLLVLRPVFAPLMLNEGDYPRRRNLWLAITATAFLAPSFWVYAPIAIALIFYTAKRDSNPAALFPLLLIAVPPLEASIPLLFGVHHQRLLILILLMPMAWRLLRDPQVPGLLRLPTDKILLAYLALQVALYWPYMSLTPALRFTVLLIVNTWLPYFVMSRVFMTRAQVRDAMACFVLSVMVLVPLAIAETRLSSLLYSDFSAHWNIPGLFSYLRRGDSVRAQLASGQPIVLGYQFAVALALWFYLQVHIQSRFWRVAGVFGLVVGLVLPFSRGPWVGALAAAAAFILAGPKAVGRTVKWGTMSLVAFGVALLTPIGDKIISYLPFIGDAEQGSVDYRTQIVEVSLTLIQQNPFFGSPFAKAQLESLRTGEGIIDIVNVYIAFALAYGLVGVFLFVSFFAVVVFKLLRAAKTSNTSDDSRQMAASLFAALVGVLVMIAAVSNYLTVPYIYLMLIGFAVAFLRALETETVEVPTVPDPVRFSAVSRMRSRTPEAG